MVKLIGIDIDNTLLDSSGQVPPDNCKAIRAAIDRGVMVVITTGRLPAEAREFAEAAGCGTQSIIGCNGAFVVVAEKQEQRLRYLPRAKSQGIIEYGRAHGLEFYAFQPDRVFTSLPYGKDDPRFARKLKTFVRADIQLLSRDPATWLDGESGMLKFVVIEEDEKKLAAAKAAFAEIGDLTLTASWETNVEIMDGGVDKGEALLRLGAEFGIVPEEIMSIGDNHNDIAMLRAAGISVAMGNASKEAREAAKFSTVTNDECGVARAIERFVLDV